MKRTGRFLLYAGLVVGLVAGVALAGPLVCAMSQAVNDWYDRHVDAINEPDRPIPSGRIPGSWGLYIAIAWTLLSLAVATLPILEPGSGIVGLDFDNDDVAWPVYDWMGVAKAALEASTRYLAYDLGTQNIRVNCISAGPVNTLAARGIAGFSAMLKHYEQHAPLKRNVLPDELGATGTFLASDGAAAITGQVLYVDCGYQVMGMTEAPKPA